MVLYLKLLFMPFNFISYPLFVTHYLLFVICYSLFHIRCSLVVIRFPFIKEIIMLALFQNDYMFGMSSSLTYGPLS